MRRSTYRRAATRPAFNRRLYGAAAALIVFGALIGVTQISGADENEPAVAVCEATPSAPGASASAKSAATDPKVGTYTDKNGVTQHKGDGQLAQGETATAAATKPKDCKNETGGGGQRNGLAILADSCDDTRLAQHDGFQIGDRCVSTEFGELAVAAKNPSLLITDSPKSVQTGQAFSLKVSTRNLVRDRFLAAGKGGYYVESSILTTDGLVRGHFHTACRLLSDTDKAVDPAPAPAFFVATEDGGGTGQPDTVTIAVPGLPKAGIAQCAAWAGDGSHRVPMMERANQTPAFDVVRVEVREGDAEPADPPADEPTQPPAGNPPPADEPADPPAGNPPPADNDGGDNGGDNDGGGDNGQPVPPKGNPATSGPVVRTTTIPAVPAGGNKPTPTPTRGGGSADEDDEATPTRSANAPAGIPKATATPKKTATSKPNATATTKRAANRTSEPTEEPTQDDAAQQLADARSVEPPADELAVSDEGTNRLALTGVSTIATVSGGLILLLAGLLVVSTVRRRRAGTHGGDNDL